MKRYIVIDTPKNCYYCDIYESCRGRFQCPLKSVNGIVERLDEEMNPEKECFEFEEDFIYAEERHNKYIQIVKEEMGLLEKEEE